MINKDTTTIAFVRLTVWSAENVYRVNICALLKLCSENERTMECRICTYYMPTTTKLEQLPLPVIFNHHYFVNDVYLATRMMIFFLHIERETCV